MSSSSSSDPLGITPNIANGQVGACAALCAEGFARFDKAENDSNVWTECKTDIVRQLLTSEEQSQLQGGCFKVDRLAWTNDKSQKLPPLIRVWTYFAAPVDQVVQFLTKSSIQASKIVNPEFKTYIKIQMADTSGTSAADAFWSYGQIDPNSSGKSGGQVAGLHEMDAVLFTQHLVGDDSAHLIISTSAASSANDGKYVPSDQFVRALCYLEYATLEPVKMGDVWGTRAQIASCVEIPGFTAEQVFMAQIRSSIQRCNRYGEQLKVMAKLGSNAYVKQLKESSS